MSAVCGSLNGEMIFTQSIWDPDQGVKKMTISDLFRIITTFLKSFSSFFFLKVVYFPPSKIYVIFQHRSIGNQNSSTQAFIFCRPYRRLKYQFQAYLPLSIKVSRSYRRKKKTEFVGVFTKPTQNAMYIIFEKSSPPFKILQNFRLKC